MTTRTELAKAPQWSRDWPVLGSELYFIPRVFILDDVLPIKSVADIVDVDLSMTPLYVGKGQEVVMRIVDGKLQVRVYAQDTGDSQAGRESP
jgi:hypothetical protein